MSDERFVAEVPEPVEEAPVEEAPASDIDVEARLRAILRAHSLSAGVEGDLEALCRDLASR